MTDQLKAELQHTLRLAVLALTQARDAATVRMEPAQTAEVQQRLANGTGQLALMVLSDGRKAHIELALIDSGVPTLFSAAMLTVEGDAACAVVPSDAVEVVDRQKMN